MSKGRKSVTNMADHFYRRLREGLFILSFAIATFLIISMATYHRSDPGWSHLTNIDHVANAAGRAGAWIADIFLYLCGYLAFIFPVVLIYGSWKLSRQKLIEDEPYRNRFLVLRALGFLLILFSTAGIASLHFSNEHLLPFSAGGVVGTIIGQYFSHVFNAIGTSLILLSACLLGVTLFTGLSWIAIADNIGAWVLRRWLWITENMPHFKLSLPKWPERKKAAERTPKKPKPLSKKTSAQSSPEIVRVEPKLDIKSVATSSESLTPIVNHTEMPVDTAEGVKASSPPPPIHRPATTKSSVFEPALAGTLPPVSLLDKPDATKRNGYTNQQLENMSRQVELRLQDFNVEAKVVAVHPGPVVTRFELQLAAGTKVSKITGLAKDLARALSVISVRVVEVIPGKSVIGLELPNKHRETVRLSEIVSSQAYHNARSPLSLAIGKDIAGHSVVVDLAKMPHLLVAGTTGSGKSVGLNAMLLSLLYKSTPKEMRMILIDPKMLELSIYDGVPHLLTPVVTDMKDAANALRWCVAEMERRYRLMASVGVRNLAGFNAKVREAAKRGQPLLDPLQIATPEDPPRELTELPYIVVLADEFADMMMVVGKKVEELIARIAQKARAAGIHLILATQRPSVDVITGLIKANIPTRIAFQVSSKIDSRTILDQQGAEQLLGHGDMLYLPPGTGVPVRVHGAFVADEEVHKVVADLKRRGEPEYLNEVIEGGASDIPGVPPAEGVGGDDGEQDELYDQAVRIVTESRRASISNIQRRLKIGYNRAARLVDTMEAAGIVGPMEQNGSREVLAPEPVGD